MVFISNFLLHFFDSKISVAEIVAEIDQDMTANRCWMAFTLKQKHTKKAP